MLRFGAALLALSSVSSLLAPRPPIVVPSAGTALRGTPEPLGFSVKTARALAMRTLAELPNSDLIALARGADCIERVIGQSGSDAPAGRLPRPVQEALDPPERRTRSERRYEEPRETAA